MPRAATRSSASTSIAARIEQLKPGKVPIYEPGLEELVRRNIKEGRLRFTTELDGRGRSAMVSFIAVGTPMSTSGAADSERRVGAAEEVAKAVAGYHIIAIKSTVPVGTNDGVREIVAEAREPSSSTSARCPEFLKEGSAIEDFMRPDRVVIGVGQRAGDRDPARDCTRPSCAPTTRSW